MDGTMTDDLIGGRGDNKTNEDGDADSSVTQGAQTIHTLLSLFTREILHKSKSNVCNSVLSGDVEDCIGS